MFSQSILMVVVAVVIKNKKCITGKYGNNVYSLDSPLVLTEAAVVADLRESE